MKKIAFLINSLGLGGAERVASRLMEYFRRKGCEIVLVTGSVAEREYSLSFSPRRYVLEEEISGNIFGRIGRIPARLSALDGIWKKENPDAIYAFIGVMNIYGIISALMSGMAARGTRVILSVRSDPDREYPTFIHKCLADRYFPKSSAVVFQTGEAVKRFSSRVQEKAVILPNALDESFMAEPYRGFRRPEIVMVGRLDANKNHEMVIRAFDRLKNDFPEYKLVIYGDSLPGDNTKERLLDIIEELGLAGRAMLAGRQDNIRQRIEAAELFVMSSDFEGMPNALLEAMATGLPVISTDCPIGGPASVIKNEKNGLLIPVGDSRALEAAMRRLLGDKSFAASLGSEASEIRTELAPETVCERWAQLAER